MNALPDGCPKDRLGFVCAYAVYDKVKQVCQLAENSCVKEVKTGFDVHERIVKGEICFYRFFSMGYTFLF